MIRSLFRQEENDHKDTPSQLATSRITKINPNDNYEIEVDEEMPALVTDNETEGDSEDDPYGKDD